MLLRRFVYSKLIRNKWSQSHTMVAVNFINAIAISSSSSLSSSSLSSLLSSSSLSSLSSTSTRTEFRNFMHDYNRQQRTTQREVINSGTKHSILDNIIETFDDNNK
uniref:Uncharacterized protein n=1 Tax=Glossina palpalis gambiensis TaxID=67801 RepID=A0A1B0BB33_9MUSC